MLSKFKDSSSELKITSIWYVRILFCSFHMIDLTFHILNNTELFKNIYKFCCLQLH